MFDHVIRRWCSRFPAAGRTVDVFFCIVCKIQRIHAHPVCTCELVTVFITKGSCQNDVEVPSVVKARLASSPWQLPTQQPRCAAQHWQVKSGRTRDPLRG